MTRDNITDARLRFYLERRDMIDEWARAGDTEPAEVDRFLRSLSEDLSVWADDEAATLVTTESAGEQWLGLAQPEWGTAAFVGLGWWPRKARFAGSARSWPWIGLRARRSGSHAETHELIATNIGHDKSLSSAFPRISLKSNWIAYRWMPCDHEAYWDDLTGYREELLETVQLAWRRFQPHVDAALGDSIGGT